MNQIFSSIQKVLQFAEREKLYPDQRVIDGSPTNPYVTINGERFLMFSSNNYLGLANNSRIKKAVQQGLDRYGMGSGGSRWVSGTTQVQIELEDAIADFKQQESAITFLAGYMANTGAIPALLNVPTFTPLGFLMRVLGIRHTPVVLGDQLNHASIIDGIKISKAKKVIYEHGDLNSLEKGLRSIWGNPPKLIVTDGVFSMDGDIAPLPGIVALAEKYGAMVFVDDAHASGVLGERGRGTLEHFGLPAEAATVMGTFTKSFGGIGGFVASSKEIIKYLRGFSRSYIFSAPIPPSIVQGLLESIAIVKENPGMGRDVLQKSAYLRKRLHDAGYNTLKSETQIIPVLIGKEEDGRRLSNEMFKKRIFVPCMQWPAVPKGQSRFRLTVMATHTMEDIDRLVDTLRAL